MNETTTEPVVDKRFEGVAAGVLRSRQAFLRDLPTLLQNPKYERWSVAYLGNDRIAISPLQSDVIRACLERGLKDDEYFIGMVVPFDDDEEMETAHA